MVIRINMFGRRVAFDFSIRKVKKEFVEGYCNRTKDGYYVPVLDYDNLELEWIVPELKRLQMDFGLSSFHIMQSSENSYHAVCFDKVFFSDYVDILECSTVDPNYTKVPLKFGKKIWTLRLSPKDNKDIKYVKTVAAQSDREKSLPHMNLLSRMFDFPVYKDELAEADEEEELIFARYPI